MATVDPVHTGRARRKDPNFLVVVIAAAIALLLGFVIAIAILAIRGKKDIPLNHTHKERNAQVAFPSDDWGRAACL